MPSNAFAPLISIVIPVYNGSNYLDRAIASALAQTYPRIEVIVVNDGSSDDGKTRDAALSFGDRIRYFEKANGGVASALNAGIANMQGDYLAWLSHDDEFLPTKLADQVAYLSARTERENVVLFGGYRIKNMITGDEKNAALLNSSTMEAGGLYRWLLAIFASKLHGCTTLIPRAVIDRHGDFAEELRTTQDYDYFCKLLRAGVKFAFQDECFIITRHHDRQGTVTNIDVHQHELHQFFVSTIDLFREELASYRFLFIEKLLGILKARGQAEPYVYLFNTWCASQCSEHAQPLWLYWECAEGTSIPDYILLCWKTVALQCSQDFRVTVVTPAKLPQYLPDIDPCYKDLAKIAHRADFIRFNLLYEHGGVWLDSDIVMFRSLLPVVQDIAMTGFAAMGYDTDDDAKFFPIIAFLAAHKHNEIAGHMVAAMRQGIRTILEVEGRQPEWDELGGNLLRDVMRKAKCGYVFYKASEYFSYMPYWRENIPCLEREFLPLLYEKIHPRMYGQALTNSRDIESFRSLSEECILGGDTLLANLFRIGFCGVRQYPVPARAFGANFIEAVYDKVYKPLRRVAGRYGRSAMSPDAWVRLGVRTKSKVQEGLSSLRSLQSAPEVEACEIFGRAFRLNIWNHPESRSGEGSTVAATTVVRGHLPKLIDEYRVHTLLDLPCGDFNWMQHVDFGATQYIGADVVPEIVELNRVQHGNANRTFLEVDLIKDQLPDADMMLCRDCLIHLSFGDIDAFLRNLHKSRIKYLLTNTYPGRTKNIDIKTGQFRPVNLEVEPFLFPKPLWLERELCSADSSEEERRFSDKALALWPVADLPTKLNLPITGQRTRLI